MWCSSSRAQCLLSTSIVRQQFPSIRDNTWRNSGSRKWNSSRFEHHIRIWSGKYQNSRREIENNMFLSRFRPINMHSWEQCGKPLGPRASGFDSLFARALVYCDNKPQPTPYLNPLNMPHCGTFGWNVIIRHWPPTRYVKLQVAHAPGMPGTSSPAADFKGNR